MPIWLSSISIKINVLCIETNSLVHIYNVNQYFQKRGLSDAILFNAFDTSTTISNIHMAALIRNKNYILGPWNIDKQ